MGFWPPPHVFTELLGIKFWVLRPWIPHVATELLRLKRKGVVAGMTVKICADTDLLHARITTVSTAPSVVVIGKAV
jgi:hypothetical protein